AEWLGQVLEGGAKAAASADCLIVGGHTIEDKEPKYGLAVIGTVHPRRILRNQGARPGDRLYLTKPLGTGVITTAIKAGFAAPEEIAGAVQSMITLNRFASEAALGAEAHAMTDVTGFGLAGHLTEMLGVNTKLGATIYAERLPVLPGVFQQINLGMIPAGAYRNRDAYRDRVRFDTKNTAPIDVLIFDPQTSGGLLVVITPESARRFESLAKDHVVQAHAIGEFNDDGIITVVD
ncbi:MAG TPA: selenide, water dikinase SelD, partial [Thermoguttaceae bacterium]